MSHYYALVIIPAEGDVDELVGEVMAPFNENLDVEQVTDEDGDTFWTNPRGLWDFWQIGGRWSGRLSGYDPYKDPALTEPCWLCRATGMRNDEAGRKWRLENPDYTCNGCSGTGRQPLWPTQFPRHDGDVIEASLSALSAISDDELPYIVLVHGSEQPLLETERYERRPPPQYGEFVTVRTKQQLRRDLELTLTARAGAGLKDRIVVVDYHS